MTKEELIELANLLGIEYYNECKTHICLKGINGDASLLYTDFGIEGVLERFTKYSYNIVDFDNEYIRISQGLATGKDFSNHLKQMGRDSLKMDLEKLLNITTHH